MERNMVKKTGMLFNTNSLNERNSLLDDIGINTETKREIVTIPKEIIDSVARSAIEPNTIIIRNPTMEKPLMYFIILVAFSGSILYMI